VPVPARHRHCGPQRSYIPTWFKEKTVHRPYGRSLRLPASKRACRKLGLQRAHDDPLEHQPLPTPPAANRRSLALVFLRPADYQKTEAARH